MAKNVTNMARGVGIGVLTGAAAIAVGSAVMKNRNKGMKNMKRSATRAVHTVGEMLNGVETMLK